MAPLLKEIDWSQPTLKLVDDPAWAAEVKRVMGRDIPAFRYPAKSPWVRGTLMQLTQIRPRHLSPRMAQLVHLVTSQENSCRFCYGMARAGLKILGLGDAQLDKVERDVRMAGSDESEREILQFCRLLSRSSPRPARADLEALIRHGHDPLAMAEVAFIVSASCMTNRLATFMAIPLDDSLEAYSPGPLQRLFMRVMQIRYPRRLEPTGRADGGGPFSEIVALIEGTQGAGVFDAALRGAFASPVLPVRTKAWVFAVVARALGCGLCERNSARLLEREGVTAMVRDRVLASLAGPELDEREAILLPWVRETVHYRTDVMQRKTHELRDRVGEDVTLEAIGLASLANSCARLSMLGE